MPLLTRDQYGEIDVLLAFGSAQMAQIISSFLSFENVGNFRVCDDLEGAVPILNEGTFNHLIVDRDLPYRKELGSSANEGEPGGIALVRALRRFPGLRSEMPVMMVLPNPSRETVLQARNAGVNEILGLPLTGKLIGQRLAYIHHSPKPFVRVATYVGPCRRRNPPEVFTGVERRNADGDWDLQHLTF